MSHKDPRVDAYIEKSADFAKPILEHLRALVHEHCPDVTETIKWRMPAFEYKGMFAGMAAFKAHCTFGLWKHDLIVGQDPKALEAMGSLGSLRSLDDLPSKAKLAKYIKLAKRLNDEGVKPARGKHAPKPHTGTPKELAAALRKDKRAKATYDALSPSHKREYDEWVGEAKREETRQKRLATTLEWLSEGKKRNWKYERK